MTKIEWTEKTWNPLSGCTKISEACQNCYAEVMARRLQGNNIKGYEQGFKVTLHPERLTEPLTWKRPQMVFVVSMGDLFHEDVPFEYIDKVVKVIEDNPQHTFQLLTKRAERMAKYFCKRNVPSNAWLGVTCESYNHYDRIWALYSIDATIRFISCEPLLSPLHELCLEGIDWVIAGGESGIRARKTDAQWFRDLRDTCEKSNTAFFFKQWGTWGADGVKRSKYKNGSLLDGEEYKMMPGDSW